MSAVVLALAPCLGVLYYYHRRDRHPEPVGRVAAAFLAGALSCAVAYPLERWGQSFFPARPAPGLLFLECLLVPGLMEEAVKLLVVLAVVWRRPAFDEPVDGLVYGAAAALGFTFGEDVRYYLVHGPDGSRVLTVAAHPWFSCFWAAGLGRAMAAPRGVGLGLVALGLSASVVVHALFDFCILAGEVSQTGAWPRHLLGPLLVLLYWVMERRLDALQQDPAAT